MKLRSKLTLSFLLVSLLTVVAVGTTTWWMLMRDFRSTVQAQAFDNFRADVTAYARAYGSWEMATRSEPFPAFVTRTRRAMGPPMPPDGEAPGPVRRPGAPFRFLLVAADGRVALPAGAFRPGDRIAPARLSGASRLRLDDGSEMLALPVGEPLFTAQDRAYVTLMQRALVAGMVAALLVAAVLGVAFGSRLAASLQELARALERMHPDGEIPEPLPVRSGDEVGVLADTFNRMSRQLIEAHREVRESNRTIRLQAEKLREQSLCDPLTGLHNRRYFDQFGQRALSRALQGGQPLCVMLADLDHFKQINDRHSHAVGDAVLQRAAELMRANTRATDVIARYGGEEFVAVFVDCPLADARQRAEALRRVIAEAAWEDLGAGLAVTISIGLCDDTALGSVEEMLKRADAMLYQAKERGRNRVEWAGAA